MFESILKRTREGESLTKKEIKQLAKQFGILKSFKKIILLIFHGIVISFFLTLAFGFLWIDANSYLFFIPFIYIIIIIIIHNNFPYYKKIITYFQAIDEAYINKLVDYAGYTIIRTANISQANNYLQKNIVLIATDNYNFFCYDDFLISTEYKLKTYKDSKKFLHVLKVIDETALAKEPFIFKLQDILGYTYIKEIEVKPNYDYDYKDYSTVLSPFEYKNYIRVELKDHTIFKFGINILEILREAAPFKEKENYE